MNENEVTGPCRKIGKCRKRSLTPYYPNDQQTYQAKDSQSDIKNTQSQKEVSILSQNQTNASQIGALSTGSGDAGDITKISHTSYNANDIWFCNSFVRSTVGKESTTHQQDSCQRITSVPKKIRLDVDFSQRFQFHNKYDGEITNDSLRCSEQLSSNDGQYRRESRRCSEQLSRNDGQYRSESRRCSEQLSSNDGQNRRESPIKHQTEMAGTSLCNKGGSPNLFHSTPIKDKKKKTVLGNTEMIPKLNEAEDMLNNSDLILAGLDLADNGKESNSDTKTVMKGGGTLKDRIKRRLQENASTKLVQSPGAVMERRREGEITVATSKAEQIQKDGSDIGVGPFYGLSSKVKALLQQHRGISSLYAWQDECLNLPAVLEGKNLIYSLPTSGGKTLVAEILIMRELLCKKRDAILILPFVSIVQEKVRGLSPFGIDLDFLVEEYAGSKGKFPPLKRRKRQSLYIATIEKAHSLINSLIENNRMDSLGLVVVDELHMIGEGGSRGATLESALLKVIYTQHKIQIVGMSATLSNIADLQTFLGAEVYSNNFRPVELKEYAKLQDNIYQVNQKAKCPEDQLIHDRVVTFKYSPDMTRVDGDHLLGLVLEVIPEKSCLLFCPTKKNCENVAMMLCKLLVKHHHELSLVKKTERKALLKELYNDGAGKICPVLQYTLHFGVAYHHSGLTTDERRLIEDAYSEGTLCLLTCTSTLAAGVNLPAKRVILRSPYVGSQFISRSQYKQMVGRAGRAGIDSSGESILITKSSDTDKVSELLTAPMETCHSSLMHDDGKGLRALILSAVGLQMTKTTSEVFACMEKTLLSVQTSRGVPCDIVEVTRQSLQQLIDLGLITQKRGLSQETDENLHHLEVTTLGRATFKGSVNLDWSSRLYSDLHQGKESLVLSSHLHLLYLVTPYDMVTMVKPSWIVYFQEMSTLNPGELKMAALIGVPEGYIARKASGQSSRQKVDDFVLGRFYLTLMLYGLWKQRTVWEVSDKFQQPRGFIQNLLSSAASFASCVYHFCQELDEFWPYQDLFGNFVQRLSYCVSAELIPLMEIPGVKLGRAKQMYSVGYRTLSQVANADPENLVKKIKQIPRKIARQIVTAARMLLNEKAEALWQEVEDLVTVPEAASTHTSPDLLSQGSVASSDILASLTDWGDDTLL